MANVEVIMSGDEAKLWASMQKVILQQKKMEDGFGNVGKKGKQAGKDLEESGKKGQMAFGDKAVASLANYAAGFATISAAAAVVKNYLEDIRKLQDDAADRMRTMADASGSFYQFAKTPQEANKAKDIATMLRTEMPDATANMLTAELMRLGKLDEKTAKYYAGLEDLKIDPVQAAEATYKIQNTFRDKTGKMLSDEAIGDKILAAEQGSTMAFEEFGGSTANLAEEWKKSGGGLNSLMASESVVANQTKSAKKMESTIHSFAEGINKIKESARKTPFGLLDHIPGISEALPNITQNVQGLDWIDTARALSGWGMLQNEKGKTVSLKESMNPEEYDAFILMMKNQESIREKTKEIAGAGGTYESKQKMLEGDMAFQAAETRHREIQIKKIQDEQEYGTATNLAEAVQKDWESQGQRAGKGRFRQWTNRAAMGTNRYIIGDEKWLWSKYTQDRESISPKTRELVRKYFEQKQENRVAFQIADMFSGEQKKTERFNLEAAGAEKYIERVYSPKYPQYKKELKNHPEVASQLDNLVVGPLKDMSAVWKQIGQQHTAAALQMIAAARSLRGGPLLARPDEDR